MNVEEIEEHGLVLAIQAAQMHSINCKEASAAATAIVSLIHRIFFKILSPELNPLFHITFPFYQPLILFLFSYLLLKYFDSDLSFSVSILAHTYGCIHDFLSIYLCIYVFIHLCVSIIFSSFCLCFSLSHYYFRLHC